MAGHGLPGVAGVGLAWGLARWLGPPTWYLAWLLLWPSASLLLLAAAYWRQEPRLLGKRPDGTVALLPRLILLPYALARRAILWNRERRGDAAWHEVSPGLYVGAWTKRRPSAAETVVDLAAELPASKAAKVGGRYLSLPVLDRWVPSPSALGTLLDEIELHGGAVYIHCVAGKGRSAMVAAAVMLRRGAAANVSEAEGLLFAARSSVALRPHQRAVVEQASTRLQPRGPRP